MIIILGAICFSLFFIEIHRLYLKLGLNFKPFNCGSCLASWTALTLYFVPEKIVIPFTIMFTAGVLAPLTERFINYLWIKLK